MRSPPDIQQTKSSKSNNTYSRCLSVLPHSGRLLKAPRSAVFHVIPTSHAFFHFKELMDIVNPHGTVTKVVFIHSRIACTRANTKTVTLQKTSRFYDNILYTEHNKGIKKSSLEEEALNSKRLPLADLLHFSTMFRLYRKVTLDRRY